MPANTRRRGFNIVGVLIAMVLVAIAIALLLPALESSRREDRILQNTNQLRWIHQGMVMYASPGIKTESHGYFPGMNPRTGEIHPDGMDTGYSGDGSLPAARFCALLNNYFSDSPEYLISPQDSQKTAAIPGQYNVYTRLTASNYSFAVLALSGTDNERAEWAETLSSDAVVLSDRAIGTGPANLSSLWTTRGSGDWTGGVVRNDNSTSTSKTPLIENTCYGTGEVNPLDDLFTDDPDADDAFLVHEDATTAYSAE